MGKAQKFFIGFVGIISAVYLFLSLEMKFGSITNPGPGFVPVLLGISGILVSAILLILNYVKTKKELANSVAKKKQEITEPNREGHMRFLGYLISVILFVPIFKYLGSIISIFLLIFVLTKISGTKGYVIPAVFAAITSGTIYVAFVTLLRITLPRGIFY